MNENASADTGYTVGALAELAGISVRTLHHYDAVGLLVPAGRSPSGYRLYSPADAARLRRILYYRALDFSLEQIAALLDDPAISLVDHLSRQHALLRERHDRDARLLAALEKEMELLTMGMQLTPEEQLEVFGTDKVGGEWADEARERWGNTEPYEQSQRRAATYTKDDWQRLKAESDEGLRAFAAALADGIPADDPRARALAEAHRAFLTRWFYDCGYDLHRNLAEIYIADPRFTATYDAVAAGLAQYVHDAIVANADAATAS